MEGVSAYLRRGRRCAHRPPARVPSDGVVERLDFRFLCKRISVPQLVVRANPRPPWDSLRPHCGLRGTAVPVSRGCGSVGLVHRRGRDDRGDPPESRDDRVRSSLEPQSRHPPRGSRVWLRTARPRADCVYGPGEPPRLLLDSRTLAWVIEAGCSIKDSTPPRLSAGTMTSRRFSRSTTRDGSRTSKLSMPPKRRICFFAMAWPGSSGRPG